MNNINHDAPIEKRNVRETAQIHKEGAREIQQFLLEQFSGQSSGKVKNSYKNLQGNSVSLCYRLCIVHEA
ncbi:hypothetical protein OnM2_097034 [Erysiphe neolycopersici]|uniref:Uncharacterized protein n=1 Tax=Erysiphe neolycopersici TaxID=212602 RepID=A0A420HAI5_9PEZI|nr:hypothetical protein OnM2_097034 [Erysiphe neolycopersici]